MTIKQSAALLVLMAAVTLAGAGCLSRPAATPSEPEPAPAVEETRGEERNDATPISDIDTSGWVRYASSQAGQIGMSFLYPPELTPVKWDTEAWGPGAVGVDFGGFGIARIPNPERLSIEEWVAKNYSGFAFSFPEVERDNAFFPALREGMCQSLVANDDFRDDAGMSGIGGTVFVDEGDGSLYAFTLGQDWNQELGDRTEVIRTAMDSIEWFAERTSCDHLTD